MTFEPLQIPHVFHARSVQRSSHARIPTGFPSLDDALRGGWPTPALIEILIDVYGIGELQLLLPLLARLTRDGPQPALLVWLNAPHIPNGVAFAQHRIDARHWVAAGLQARDVLWSCEQALRSQACSVVLAWTSTSNTAALRRLKLAAVSAHSVGILFRPIREVNQPSPASLRIVLQPEREQLSLEIIKNEARMPSRLSIDVSSRTVQDRAR
jgi:protein ImuA